MAKTGSETVGAAGDKSKMTLFKDDRAEDIGAIIVATLVIAYIMVATISTTPPAPAAAPAVVAAPAATPAVPEAPAPAAPAAK